MLYMAAYFTERFDRIYFCAFKIDEFSLKCYKDLLQNFLDLPIVISNTEAIVFQNHGALKKFNCLNSEEFSLWFEKNLFENREEKENLHSYDEEGARIINRKKIINNIDTLLYCLKKPI